MASTDGYSRSVVSPADGVKCSYQPVFGLGTGNMVAVGVDVIPHSGTTHDLLRAASKRGELTSTDIDLLSQAARGRAAVPHTLPAQLSVLAATVARETTLADHLHTVLREIGCPPKQVVLKLKPPFSGIRKQSLIEGITRLRRNGFRIGLADLGDGDIPFTVFTQLKPDVVFLDPAMVSGMAEDADRIAFVEALALLCGRLNAWLVAEGVSSTAQLAVLKKFGVHAASGELLGVPTPHIPAPELEVSSILNGLARADWQQDSAPTLTAGQLAIPAVTLPADATAEDVRSQFVQYPETASVVLVDPAGKACGFVERNRFLIAVTGAYGHALYAKRPAYQLAEPPRAVSRDATARQLLDLISAAPRQQNNDDLIVTDESGYCVGVVPVVHAMRALADMQIEHAARLHPLTGLPGTEAISADVSQRISRQQAFSVSWLDVDHFKSVNDNLGFAAGDQLIKLLGRSLQSTTMNRPHATVAHIGGDDFLLVAELDDVLPLVATVLDRPVTVEKTTPTLSVATLVCTPGSIESYQAVSRLFVPLKHAAKELSGTSWVVGRPGTERMDILRGHAGEAPRAG